jgi:hypothetical protein
MWRVKDRFQYYGEMAEWSKAADSKSVEPLAVPRVRIPISPPIIHATSERPLTSTTFFKARGLFLSDPPIFGNAHPQLSFLSPSTPFLTDKGINVKQFRWNLPSQDRPPLRQLSWQWKTISDSDGPLQLPVD